MRLPEIPVYAWSGLNTRANPYGMTPLECQQFDELTVRGRDAVRRDGFARVGILTGNLKAMAFTAASSHYVVVPIDTRVWAMGTQFTIECCVALTGTGDDQAVFYAGATTPTMALDTLSGNWRWRVWDSAGTLTTVTVGTASAATQTLQLMRDGASLTSRLDNATAGTGTMSATLSTRTPSGDLRIARNGGTNYLGGTIDYIRAFGRVKSDHNDRLVRCVDPCASYVLMDYDFNLDSNSVVYDLSTYENHGTATNGPSETTSLCHPHAPIRGLAMYTDHAGQRYIYAEAGGAVYLCAVE